MISNIKYKILQNYRIYKLIEESYRLIKPGFNLDYYPIDLNIEITTICNSKCAFCTHEELVNHGKKQAKHMEFEFAKSVVDKLREITKEQEVPEEKIRISPVGLGESLLHPDFFNLIEYIRGLFPKACIHSNTNGISLDETTAEKLIDSGLDSIVFSLCFNNAITYERETGVDKYDLVVENIKRFLIMKGNRSPKTIIHIFDVPENRKVFSGFIKQWSPLINRNDFIGLYKYLPLTKWEIKTDRKYPCNQIWNVLMIDIDGYIFPCCIGAWMERTDQLCIGHINEPWKILKERITELRTNHQDGNFGFCEGCPYLYYYKGENRVFQRKLKHNSINKYGNR